MFKVLAMKIEDSHLNTVYLATVDAAQVKGGSCYLPIGKSSSCYDTYMCDPVIRLGALQLPRAVQTHHPRLWEDAEEMISERLALAEKATF